MKSRRADVLVRLLVLVVAAAPMVAVAAAAHVIGGIRADSNDLRHTGVEVTATVVKRYYGLELEYDVDGTRRRGAVACRPDNCTDFEVGDRVRVRVDPNEPQRVVLAENPYSRRGMAIAWTVIAAAIVGAILALYAMAMVKRRLVDAAAVDLGAAREDIRRNATFLTGFVGLFLLLAGIITLSAGGNVIAVGATLVLAGLLLVVFASRLLVAFYRRMRTRA